VSNFLDFRHLEPVYALAVERQDYRRGAWLAIRAIRTRPTNVEKELWTFRLRECLKRRNA